MLQEGQTVGWWTINKYLGVNQKQQKIWECKCKCGNIKIKTTGVVNAHSHHSCGCSRVDTSGDIGGYLWSNIKISAKRRNIPFLITSQQAWDKFNEQGGVCALSGRQLCFTVNQYERYNKQNASLDRIDSSKPYEIHNIQWIDKDVNIIKGKLCVADLKYYCGLLTFPRQPSIIQTTPVICGGLWYGLTGNARKRNLEVLFDRNFLADLFIAQNGCCALTGLQITLPINTTEFRKFQHTASIDRRDSNLSYTSNNVQWIHKTVNSMKMHFQQDYFLQTCEEIYLH